MKRTFLIGMTALLSITACVPKHGQNNYNYSEIGQSVDIEFAKIVKAKQINIQGRNTGTGATVGMAAGGAAGYQVGNGNGQLAGLIAGMVIGGIAGHMAEQEMANQRGYEYVVVTEHKKTKSIVQYQNVDDIVFKKGDRVMVQTSGSFQRVLPTDDLPEEIKRPKGVKILD